jgi:hypothetical protein
MPGLPGAQSEATGNCKRLHQATSQIMCRENTSYTEGFDDWIDQPARGRCPGSPRKLSVERWDRPFCVAIPPVDIDEFVIERRRQEASAATVCNYGADLRVFAR